MKFCMVDTQIKKVLHLISDVTQKMSSSPTRPTSLPDKKMKKWHNFYNTVNSRYNGSEGTNEFYALLADCVIAKTTILNYLLCYLLCYILSV